ncbi:hypothetical protein WAI453_007393 [Rhynchosporium graminicola]
MPPATTLAIETLQDVEELELSPLKNWRKLKRTAIPVIEEAMEACLKYLDDHPWTRAAEACRIFDFERNYREIQRRIKNPSLCRQAFNRSKPLLDSLKIQSTKNIIRGQHDAGFSANKEDIESIVINMLSR